MPGFLDTANYDEDVDDQSADAELFAEGEDERTSRGRNTRLCATRRPSRRRAAEIYELYASQFKKRFKWLRPDLFVAQLKKDLTTDSARLLKISRRLRRMGASEGHETGRL